MLLTSYRTGIRTIKHADGSLLATYVEEKPFEGIQPAPQHEMGWRLGTMCNTLIAAKHYRRLLKVAVPPLVDGAGTALQPMLVDLYLPIESELAASTLTGGARPPPPDFIVYEANFDEGVRGNAAAMRRDWWTWDVAQFDRLYLEELQEPSFASPLPVSSRRSLSTLAATASAEIGERQQHYVAAFSRWIGLQLRERHLTLASTINNQQFQFEFEMVLQPKVHQKEGQLHVERQPGSAVSKIFIELQLFEGSSDASALYRTLIKEGVDNIALASLTSIDSNDEGESPSLRGRGSKGLPAWISCQLKFTLTCDDHNPTKLPTSSPFTTRFQRSKTCPPEHAAAANMLVSVLQAATEELRPPPGMDNTLLDVIPALERAVIDTRLLPVVKWLRMVGAFRSVFGAVINDSSIAPIVATRVAQFLVVDTVRDDSHAFIVTLTAAMDAKSLPHVAFRSAQFTNKQGEPITFKWSRPSAPPPGQQSMVPPLEPDDGCAIAAAVFEYLHQNMVNFAKIVAINRAQRSA